MHDDTREADQVSVDELFGLMDVGEALIESVGCGGTECAAMASANDMPNTTRLRSLLVI